MPRSGFARIRRPAPRQVADAGRGAVSSFGANEPLTLCVLCALMSLSTIRVVRAGAMHCRRGKGKAVTYTQPRQSRWRSGHQSRNGDLASVMELHPEVVGSPDIAVDVKAEV